MHFTLLSHISLYTGSKYINIQHWSIHELIRLSPVLNVQFKNDFVSVQCKIFAYIPGKDSINVYCICIQTFSVLYKKHVFFTYISSTHSIAISWSTCALSMRERKIWYKREFLVSLYHYSWYATIRVYKKPLYASYLYQWYHSKRKKRKYAMYVPLFMQRHKHTHTSIGLLHAKKEHKYVKFRNLRISLCWKFAKISRVVARFQY